MASLVFEKCDQSVIRDVFQTRMVRDWPRLRSKMVKILDKWYFKEMDKEELA